MTESLESLLNGALDYAGAFPPARLDIETALERYVRYLRGPENWIVGRLVCPVSGLSELNRALGSIQGVEEIPLSVIGTPCNDYDSWQDSLESDAKEMTSFIHAVGDAAAIEVYEVKVPSHAVVENCLKDLRAFSEVDVYVELPWGPEMDESVALVGVTEWVGVKARTGGLEASAYPTAEALAGFIHSAISIDVPMKLTAGLHHPFPGYDEDSGGHMHGFLNVYMAAALALTHDFSRSDLVNVLKDDDVRHWSFDDEGMKWKGFAVSLDEIESMRDIFNSVGSCSIDEPLSDLKRVGFLKEVK